MFGVQLDFVLLKEVLSHAAGCSVPELEGVGVRGPVLGHPVNLIGLGVVLGDDSLARLICVGRVEAIEEIPFKFAILHMIVELGQNGCLVDKLGASFNVEEYALSRQSSLDFVTWPCNQVELWNLDFLFNIEKLRKTTNLVVLLLFQRSLD